MTIKRDLIAGGAIALLTVSAFTVRRWLGRKPKADWNVEHWLRLLSGANVAVPTQPGQASQPVAKPKVGGQADYPLYRS